MNGYQKQLVQCSFRHIVPVADQFASLFYSRLFALEPSLRSLFKGDINQQGLKLMMTLQLAVNSLDDLDGTRAALERLGREHATYGVQPDHYATVGDVLLWTLEQELGAVFSADAKEAWTAVYSHLANIMKETPSDPTE